MRKIVFLICATFSLKSSALSLGEFMQLDEKFRSGYLAGMFEIQSIEVSTGDCLDKIGFDGYQRVLIESVKKKPDDDSLKGRQAWLRMPMALATVFTINDHCSSIGLLKKDSQKAVNSQPMPYENVQQVTIEGVFQGWSGETIVKLSNGELWQQADKYVEQSMLPSPSAFVLEKGGAFRLKIDGVDKSVKVVRIK